jgi:murein DD-endopeptidase MepM/ murein hydrolase activator NlpD
MVVPDGSEKVYSRTISSNILKLVVVLTSIWLIFLLGVTIVYARLLVQASRSAMLQEENQRLREYFARVVDIEESFRKNQELTARLAEMAGINLQKLNSPPEIEFESLGVATAADSPAVVVAVTDSGVAPEELAARRIPYGRPLYGWITRTYGAADDSAGQHAGIDFAVREGTNVAATAGGVVISSGWDDVLGNFVVIDHENGFLTTYAHNKELLVEKGARVARGAIIAISGNTGHSSAPHLHYEILKDGVPVDPSPYLD